MDEQAPKILIEFTLVPDAQRRLQDYMDDHHAQLQAGDSKAQDGLKQLMEEVLPPESQNELKQIFAGNSEYAVLIHGLPERRDLQRWAQTPKPEDTYSYFLGNAVYALNGAESKSSEIMTRNRHTAGTRVFGDFLHRDYPGEQSYAVFSSPYNGENALTSLFSLKGALETIPETLRGEITVRIHSRDQRPEDETSGQLVNLNELLAKLRIKSDDAFKQISYPSNAEHRRVFEEAISQRSVNVNMQPGDLLFLDEAHMFHTAHKGNVSAVPVGQKTSRIFQHNSGALTGQAR